MVSHSALQSASDPTARLPFKLETFSNSHSRNRTSPMIDLTSIEQALTACKSALVGGADPFDVGFVQLLVDLECAVHAEQRKIDDEWAARRAAGTSRLNRKPLRSV